MLNNILLKTIFTKRWMLISWCIGIIALVVFTMVFYPTFSKSFGESLKDVPESLKPFLGDAATYSTIAGYTDLQVIAQLNFMTIIFGIILFTGILAGEENEGTLQSLLAQPVRRSRVYFEKFAASVVLLVGTCLSILVGVVIGLLFINESLRVDRLFIATLAIILISLVFSTIAYAIGAATGKRGLSGGLAGVLAFTSLLVSSLAASASSLKFVDKFSPFHYFNKPGILQFGPNWEHMVVLGAIVVVALVIGSVLFVKRDIYQH